MDKVLLVTCLLAGGSEAVKIAKEFMNGRIIRVSTYNVSSDAENYLVAQLIRGDRLVVISFKYPQLFSVTKRPDGNFTYDGLGYEFLHIANDFFNTTLQFVPVDPEKLTKAELSEVLIDQLQNNEVDIAPFTFEISTSLLEKMALSYPSWIANYGLLQPWPAEESRLLAPIRPFTFEVWVCFIISTLAFMLFMNVVAVLHTEPPDEEGDTRSASLWERIRTKPWLEICYAHFEYVLTIIAAQGNSISYTTGLAVRLAVCSWLLAMFIMTYAYTGVLTAVLAVPKLEPTVDTLEALVEGNQLKVTKEGNCVMYEQIMSATSGPYVAIRESFEQDPSLIIKNTDMFQLLDNVIRRSCAYPGVTDIIEFLIREDTRLNGRCRLVMPPTGLSFFVALQTGIQKDSLLTEILKEYYLIRIWDNGLLSYMKKKFFPSTDQCRVDNPPESQTEPISLIDLMGPFFILGSGLALSIVSFIAERIWYSTKNFKL